MREHFAALDLRQAPFDFADEPLVIIDQTFDRLTRQGFGIAAPLVSDARELGLQVRREVHFHAASLQEATGLSTCRTPGVRAFPVAHRIVGPPLRHELVAAGIHVGEIDVVIQNGRVRAGITSVRCSMRARSFT